MEVVVDCPGPILSKLNSEKVLLIKPNLEEFHAMTKSKVKTIAAVKKKAQGMLKRSSFVCISSVDGGALLVSENGSYFGRIAKVKIRSTVGAGDSMVAAMVSQFSQGNKSPEDILRWGLAASAATLTETGTQLGSAALIKSLYKKTKVYEV
jgi:fructose-1-phosphate kinase PfkB-like protein